MISKIRKYQDSWLTKAILALTALSFMSLFGVSGYVTSAGKNRAVIKVDNKEIMQDEMNAKLQDSIRKSQKMFGDTIDIDDEMRKDILSSLVKQNVTDMIIAREAEKTGASISDELIEQIISTQPEFMDASGKFNPELLRRQLSYFDMNEQEYIDNLRKNILSRHLVYSAVEGVIFPHFMNDYIAKIENQQKVFSYVLINPADIKIDREITQEEIEQYYDDFAPQFEEAEKRDISFIELKTSSLAKNINPSEEDIESYYQENIHDYVVPETRQVLQMVFDDEASANEALTALNQGDNFYQVASNKANQDKATTNLGEVTFDSLLPELSQDVFDAKLNQIVGPINSEFGWHILKIVKITPKKETSLSQVRHKIIDTIRQEQAYDIALGIIANIEDSIGSGATLSDIANQYNTKINIVSGLKEDGSYISLSNKKFAPLISSADFIDSVFSYNENEVTQTIETDDGFVFASVTGIDDAHIKALSDVETEINKIWAENEKSAIAQEIVNDIAANLDNGEALSDIASRFNIKLTTTPPLKRGETFAKLNSSQLAEAYQTPINEYKLLSSGGITTIITPIRIINKNQTESQTQLDNINIEMRKTIEEDMASELVDNYAKDMDVRIKYRLLGLED